MTSLYRTPAGRTAVLRVLGPMLLTAALVSGCGGTGGTGGTGGSTASAPASFPGSPPAGAGLNSSVLSCLKRHGVSLPGGRPSPGAQGQPPAGGISGSFIKALKACGVSLPAGVGG